MEKNEVFNEYKFMDLVSKNCRDNNEELLMYFITLPTFTAQYSYLFWVVKVDDVIKANRAKYNSFTVYDFLSDVKLDGKSFGDIDIRLDEIMRSFDSNEVTDKELLQNEEFSSLMDEKKKMYDKLLDSNELKEYFFDKCFKGEIEFREEQNIEECIDIVYNLDYSKELAKNEGLDDDALCIYIPSKDVCFYLPKVSDNDYYKPVVDLINELLHSAYADKSYLFSIKENENN